MDPLAVFALSFMTIAAANNAAVMQHYAASAQYAYPAYAQPGWGAPPALYVPGVAPVQPSRPAFPVEMAPTPKGNSAASREFVEHWQNFIEPRR